MRVDSAFYGTVVVSACRTLHAHLPVTAPMHASLKAAPTAGIVGEVWAATKCPR
ncbi:hypothetical protein ABZ424_10940 [Streptomyces sp. NPDC005790]|uniref:hypothetical protein n=1 Tax=Streptomyces sp. NPDC005790 TaxID=3154777 RepID=UPI00340CD6FC